MTIKAEAELFLTDIREQLNNRIAEVSSSLEEGQKEVEGMHEYYWENYTEMDQYGYENFDNQQALLTQVNANQELQILRHRLKKMQENPFFGRVDFRYSGEEETDIFYIGIGNFAPRAGAVPLVFDWRAPVSGLFYDFDAGPASYEAPAGRMEGDITSKRQYKIRNGKLVYAFESDVKIDDEILGAELAGHGETKLRNIVRTIQKEQNQIIRNTKDRIMVIQGVAGSGKTSIALHRIAYLLYHDRKNLKSSNILILSPNSVFSDYISRILPELGEENIREMSFDLFAYQQLQDTAADCEDLYDHLEQVLQGTRDEGVSGKDSPEFLEDMEEFLLMLEDRLVNFRDVTHRGQTITDSRIIHLFYEKFMEIPLLSRMDAVAEYFIDEVETICNTDLEEEERQLVLEKFRKMYASTDLYVLYNTFLKEYGYRYMPNRPLEKRKLLYEDVYPLLYMKYRLLTSKVQKGIKHLVIDEMQDYSELQYRIIHKIFPCRMTILGDLAQKMTGSSSLGALPKIFGKTIRQIVMNKSYRNTMEIASYANSIAGITDMDIFERHGEAVQEMDCRNLSDAAKRVWEILSLKERSDFETAAVITRTEEEAKTLWMELNQANDFNRGSTSIVWLNRNSHKFEKGLTVTTFYLAKGLEFERVFSVFPKKDRSDIAMRGRYIAATRALHALHVINV
ncbi:MAG: UvrD-helicase domain-containing protein [Blautia sp.]|nr:UvrD-helicase domain-containing protein [Blautia sp.]